MKYKIEDYINSEFYGNGEDDIENYRVTIVKCRRPHKCVTCNSEIKIGDYAYYESGFMDSYPVSAYTCMQCLDEYLDKINEIEEVKE